MSQNLPYEFTLPNGLRVVYAYDPHKVSFTSAVTAKAGAFYEPVTAPRGLAHFTEHLSFDGTQAFPDKEKLVELIEDVGGDWNGYTSNQSVTYYAHTLAEDWKRSLTFISEIFVNALLTDQWIDHEKAIISEEIHGYDTDPWQSVYRELNVRCSTDSRLQSDVIGTVKSVESTTLADIRLFKEGTYTARNAVVGIAGPVPVEEVRSYVEECFGSLPAGDLLPDPEFPILDPVGVVPIEWPTAQHAHLALAYHGFATTDPRSVALALGLSVFGGSASSRLFRVLREREGLCYMVNASSNSYQTFGSSGVMSGLSVKNLPRFIDAYLRERDLFISTGPTAEELEREKKSALASLLFKADSTFGLATHYAGAKLFRPDRYLLTDIADTIRSVSLEDVHAVTTSILSQQPLIAVASKEIIDESTFQALSI